MRMKRLTVNFDPSGRKKGWQYGPFLFWKNPDTGIWTIYHIESQTKVAVRKYRKWCKTLADEMFKIVPEHRWRFGDKKEAPILKEEWVKLTWLARPEIARDNPETYGEEPP